MPLRRLTSLEAGKLEEEDAALAEKTRELRALLADPAAVRGIVAAEAAEVASRHGDERRTAVLVVNMGFITVVVNLKSS